MDNKITIRPYNLGKYRLPEDITGGVCLEIGANVGSFFDKYSSFFSKIHYYEPISECYDICQEKSKKYNHITGYNLAGYSESGTVHELVVHQNKDSGSTAVKSPILNDEWSDIVIQNVNTISLEDMIKNLNVEYIDYCKSDCETSEYHIFLNKDISKIRYIGMELHWQVGYDRWYELISYIEKTHTLIYGNNTYTTGMNKDVLYKLNSI